VEGKKLDIDDLADYAHRFGLGEKTQTFFAEKEGLIPTRAWKKKVKGERWWQGETLSAAIGQSFILVTPIQIARMVGAIHTGELVRPRIVTHEAVVKEPLRIKPSTRAFLQEVMYEAVRVGTCKR